MRKQSKRGEQDAAPVKSTKAFKTEEMRGRVAPLDT